LFEYDVQGRLIRQVQPDPDLADTVLAPETEFAYDAVGNLVRTTDALDRITTTEYDSLNRPVFTTLPQTSPISTEQIKDNGVSGFTTTGSWNPYTIGGQNAGYEGTFSATPPGVASATATWTFSTLEPGYFRVWTTWFADDQFESNAPYAVSDGSQLLSTIVVDQTESPDDLVASSWQWEALGGPYFIGSGTLKVQLSDLTDGTYVVADAVRIERINPGTLSAYDQNGNRISVTDELGRTSRMEYDGVGRIKKSTQPAPDGTGPLPAPFSVNTSNSLGNLTVQTDHLNRVTTREYDLLHRLTKEFQPDPDGIAGLLGLPITQYGYDAVGNLKTVTDPLLRITSYDYDALNRRTKETMPRFVAGAERFCVVGFARIPHVSVC